MGILTFKGMHHACILSFKTYATPPLHTVGGARNNPILLGIVVDNPPRAHSPCLALHILRLPSCWIPSPFVLISLPFQPSKKNQGQKATSVVFANALLPREVTVDLCRRMLNEQPRTGLLQRNQPNTRLPENLDHAEQCLLLMHCLLTPSAIVSDQSTCLSSNRISANQKKPFDSW